MIPEDAIAKPGKAVALDFAWDVPATENWHRIKNLSLRLKENGKIVMRVMSDMDDRTLSLFDDEGHDVLKTGAIGNKGVLRNSYVAIPLSKTSLIGSGPDGPRVNLIMTMRFSEKAANHVYDVEVSASDRNGIEDSFAHAAWLTVKK